VPGGPRAIAVGFGGAWVATAAGSVVRIDAQTLRPGPPIPVADPAGVAIGAGSVWITSRSADTVIRIDPRTSRISRPPIRVGSQPTDIAFADGAAWSANSADGTVSRVDAASDQAGPPIRVAPHHPLSPGGSARAIEQPGDEVLALAAGQGAIWVATTDQQLPARFYVSRIDPASRAVGGPLAITGGVPLRLAAGAGGVWATDPGSALPGSPQRSPRLERVDPGGRALSGPATGVGRDPAGVTVGLGRVWVTSAAENTVTEITPSPER
jgi:DNA-binding beta-propeller fold protein YncE